MAFLRGQFIAFSGIDGAGKSTQIEILFKALRENDTNPLYLWTRGGYTGPFNAIKAGLRRLFGKKLPPSGRSEERDRAFKNPFVRNLWLSLAIIDLIFVYGIYIRIYLISGRIIIADRYLWDTWIDFRLNFPKVGIDQWPLWRVLKALTPKPDVGFLLLIPVEESLRRSGLKNEPFPDSEDVLRQRLALYYELPVTHKLHTIDCLQPIDVIRDEIMGEVEKVST